MIRFLVIISCVIDCVIGLQMTSFHSIHLSSRRICSIKKSRFRLSSGNTESNFNDRPTETQELDILSPEGEDTQAVSFSLEPPKELRSLSVGDTYYFSNTPVAGSATTSTPAPTSSSAIAITRVAEQPDMFVIRNKNHLLSTTSTSPLDSLIQLAKNTGLEYAETKSGQNSVRRNSYICWVYPPEDHAEEKEDMSSSPSSQTPLSSLSVKPCQGTQVAQKLTIEMANMLLRPTKHNNNNNNINDSSLGSARGGDHSNQFNYKLEAEPLQIVKYTKSGCFDLHHDGFGRVLTAITYLNGVGGTWFPYAQVGTSNEIESLSSKTKEKPVPGKDGLLIVGSETQEEEGESNYHGSSSSKHVLEIEAGDSIVFYNYGWTRRKNQTNGKYYTHPAMDWKALHAGLPTKGEKWIGTNWYRSDRLAQDTDYQWDYIGRAIQKFTTQ